MLGGCLEGDVDAHFGDGPLASINSIVVRAAGPPGAPFTGGSPARVTVEVTCEHKFSLIVYVGASPVTAPYGYPPPQWDLLPNGFQPCPFAGEVAFEFTTHLPHVPQQGGGALLAIHAFLVEFYGPIPLAPCPTHSGEADDLLVWVLPGGRLAGY